MLTTSTGSGCPTRFIILTARPRHRRSFAPHQDPSRMSKRKLAIGANGKLMPIADVRRVLAW